MRTRDIYHKGFGLVQVAPTILTPVIFDTIVKFCRQTKPRTYLSIRICIIVEKPRDVQFVSDG